MQFPLTQNAIIHLSAGFDGPFLLQVFSIRKHPTNPHQINMCLTDGEIYIGAFYNPPKFSDLENFNIVKITAQYFDRMKPINIKTLDIISRSHKKIIGNSPCTLVDYFNKQVHFIADSEPKKKVKLTTEDMSYAYVGDSNSLKAYQQSKLFIIKEDQKMKKIQQSKQEHGEKVQKEQDTNQKRPKGDKKDINEKKFKKKLRLASDSEIDDGQMVESSPDNFKATFLKEPERRTAAITNIGDVVQNSHIHDLFERHIGWVLLCRVNYRSLTRCQNGIYAVNFVLQDQNGDEIKCVYFQPSLERAQSVLNVAKYYLFTGGEIKESKQAQLQIIFDRNSQFIEKPNLPFQLNPKKFTRIHRILEEPPDRQINVLGIIRKIKNKGEKLKTKNKYTATLCDPITNYEIDFLLFLNEDEKPIQKGMIVVLHNYQIYRQNNICRLNSTYRSYYFQQKPTKHQDKFDLINQFFQITQQTEWDNDNYKNISMFAFTQRPIRQLKNISKKTEDEKIYSSLDCWIMEINKKKTYYACKTCKKPTEKKQMGLFQCSICKKMVQVTLTLTLSVTFTDYTGSCMIDVIGEHAQNLIQKKALQYNLLTGDEQNNHLETLRYKNVHLRLKSEKKTDGKLIHSVWGIEKNNPQNTLKEIKKILVEKTSKFDDRW